MTTEIREAYEIIREHNGSEWVRIAAIHEMTGLSAGELAEEITRLMDEPGFRAEPEPFGFRITEDDRRYAPIIGGEARHLISWI